jgi:Lon protease-like protein
MNIRTVGTQRFRVLQLARTRPFAVGRVERFPLEATDADQVAALARQASSVFIRYMRRAREVVGNLVRIESAPKDECGLAFLIAGALPLSLPEKQGLLGTRTLSGMLRSELRVLGRELALLAELHRVQESGAGYVVAATGQFSLS